MVDTYVAVALGCWPDTAAGFMFNNLLGIRNTSGYTVDVRNIIMTPLLSADATIDQQPQSLHRISALTSGDAISALKNDTAAATLPAVVIARAHGVVTTTGALRQFGALYGQRITGGTPIWSARSPGHNSVAQTWQRTGDQRIVLREGEGFAWLQTANPNPRTQEALFVVRNAASGDTYTYRVPNTPISDLDVMFALLNGTGSGVVLELVHAEVIDLGMQALSNGAPWSTEVTQLLPGFRVLKCRTIEDGEAITPVKRDTAAVAVPSGITCLRGGAVHLEVVSTQRAMTSYEWAASTAIGQKLFDQQQIGLIRGLPRDPVEAWSPGSATFPRRMEGASRDVLRSRTNRSFPGVKLRRNEALSVAYWYNTMDAETVAYAVSYAEAPNTGAKFNIEIEFSVAVGQGEFLPSAATSAATPIIS